MIRSMSTTLPATLIAGALALLVIPAAAVVVSQDDDAQTESVELMAAADTAGAAQLTDEHVTDIVYMRQEEKLAGDVYKVLGDKWGSQVFQNINRSELQHQSMMSDLLAQFDLDDPVADLAAGKFLDPDLQNLYDELVERGDDSLEEALRVGAHIEELDITDLRASYAGVAAIDDTYERLEAASQNHLRAFVRNLANLGVEYEPVIFSPEAYAEIIDNESDVGSRRGNQENGQQTQGYQSRQGDGYEQHDCDGHEQGHGRQSQGQGSGQQGRGQQGSGQQGFNQQGLGQPGSGQQGIGQQGGRR